MAATGTTGMAQTRRIARLRRRAKELRLPWIPIIILGLVLITAAGADVIAPHDPRANDLSIRVMAPFDDLSYPLGTDLLGKDMLSRLIHGSRDMLTITAPAMGFAILFGTTIGLVSGYAGGWVDSVLMRLTDGVLGFPSILVAFLVVLLLGTGVFPVIVAVTATTWARFARMIRGDVLATRDRDFVVLARISGVAPVMIIWRHIFPNVVNTLMVITSVTVGQVILLVASLSFLGLGLSPGDPSWGIMVAEGRKQLVDAWWISLLPGIVITLVVMAFNFFGDWLRDTLDPKLRRAR